MRKILVIGGSGLLGYKILKESAKLYQTSGTYFTHPFKIKDCNIYSLDIGKKSDTQKLISKTKPDCVMLTSAQTDVDKCERKPEEAYEIHVKGTQNVAHACKNIGAKLIYVSTDYVFDGLKRERYTDEDNPNPLSVYGQTKLEGEKIIEKVCDDYAIARMSVLFGWNENFQKMNFVTWVMNKLEKEEVVTLFKNQYVSPTYADFVAKVLLDMYAKDLRGLYHISSSDCLDRYEIGVKIANIFGYNADLIKPLLSSQINLLAKRPKYSCLDVTKIERELGVKMMSVDEGLRAMKKQGCRK